MDVYTTRYRRTSGRLVHEFNFCTVSVLYVSLKAVLTSLYAVASKVPWATGAAVPAHNLSRWTIAARYILENKDTNENQKYDGAGENGRKKYIFHCFSGKRQKQIFLLPFTPAPSYKIKTSKSKRSLNVTFKLQRVNLPHAELPPSTS